MSFFWGEKYIIYIHTYVYIYLCNIYTDIIYIYIYTHTYTYTFGKVIAWFMYVNFVDDVAQRIQTLDTPAGCALGTCLC